MTADREQTTWLAASSVGARLIHHAEAAALLVALVAPAVWQRDQLSPWLFWTLLAAPDLFGYVPASFMGSGLEKGALPPRGAAVQRLAHHPRAAGDRSGAGGRDRRGAVVAPRLIHPHHGRPGDGLRVACGGRAPGYAVGGRARKWRRGARARHDA
jgi:hypothetical protein